ncbi:hypothetical protein JCM11491_000389 [Sporobolomyces phaffii]
MITTLLLSLASLAVAAKASFDLDLAPVVCSPRECLRGHHALSAGVVVSTQPVNLTLLPGTYTRSTLNVSALEPAHAVGFAASGSPSSPFTVAVLPGVTTYSSSYYEGTPTHFDPTSNSSSVKVGSLVLDRTSYAVLKFDSNTVVVWDSVPDVLNLGIPSTETTLVESHSTDPACPARCATCSQNATAATTPTCQCEPGWTGPACDACLANYFGPSCLACPAGCTECDDGLTGTGLCLEKAPLVATSPSLCNCVSGVCQGNSTSATCDCNAGWTRASNGTQCSTCAPGYYLASTGDCQACDPSCETCTAPAGVCQTCRDGLQPVSSDPTRCTTATTALSNGTFVACAARSFYSAAANDCVACDAMCETCYKAGSDGCLECRRPNVLLEGLCVAVDPKTGVCDGRSSKLSTGSNAGWVYDNHKRVCDALPAKCSKGGVDSFSSSSTRNDVTCSACIPGTFLVDRRCVDSCPDGTTVSNDGSTCQPCDSACGTCAPSLPSYCTACANPAHLVLNGTCIAASSCPNGFFLSPTASSSSSSSLSSNSTPTATPARTCLACHPDCATCSPDDPTRCLSCDPASGRPVLDGESGTCVATCARDQYFDRARAGGGGQCVECAAECASCWGSGAHQCLSCTGDRSHVRGGKCVATDDCHVVDGFGVCLKDLVTVAPRPRPDPPAAVDGDGKRGKKLLPWWLILVTILAVLATIAVAAWWFRKREQKRRREHTAKFARGLGDKEVDQKLAALPYSVAYPPLPRARPSSSTPPPPPPPLVVTTPHEVPLTPRFVLEDPTSPISPSPSASSFGTASHRIIVRPLDPTPAPPPPRLNRTTSASSYGSAASYDAAPRPRPFYSSSSSQRTFTTAAGNTLVVNSKNPFFLRKNPT